MLRALWRWLFGEEKDEVIDRLIEVARYQYRPQMDVVDWAKLEKFGKRR